MHRNVPRHLFISLWGPDRPPNDRCVKKIEYKCVCEKEDSFDPYQGYGYI